MSQTHRRTQLSWRSMTLCCASFRRRHVLQRALFGVARRLINLASFVSLARLGQHSSTFNRPKLQFWARGGPFAPAKVSLGKAVGIVTSHENEKANIPVNSTHAQLIPPSQVATLNILLLEPAACYPQTHLGHSAHCGL